MSLIEPFIDDEAVRRVAEAFPSATEEQVRETVRLRMTTRLGYRRIGRRLSPPLKKDVIMRICRMYEAISKPSEPPAEEDEDLKKLRARVAEKERVKRIREERERLLRKDMLLSLENEGDDLVQRIVEDISDQTDHPYFDEIPKTQHELKSYCKRERLSLSEALREFDVVAWDLLDEFDDWYEFQREVGECKAGLGCLIGEVWRRLYWGLKDKEKTKGKTKGGEGK